MTAKTLLCYVRKSVVKSASDEVPPAIQRRALLAECEASGYTPEFYEDIEGHSSGASEKQRPGWRALKAQLRRSDVAGIAVYSLSRGWRNVRNFLNDLAEMEGRNLSLVCIKEKLDTGSAMGRLLTTVLMSMYAFESEVASERMAETIRFKRQNGRTWGLPPFGTIREEGILKPDPEYIPTLTIAYELYATGDFSTDALASKLNADGLSFRDRNGVPREWRRDDCRRVLAAWRIYSGEVPAGRTKDNPDWYAGSHDAILPVALCSQVAQELSRRSRPSNTHEGIHKHYEYLLSGHVYCTCGQPLYGAMTRHGVPVYRHRVKGTCAASKLFNADVLDALVIDRLREWRLSERDKDDIIEIVKSKSQELRAILGEAPDIATIRAEYHIAVGKYERLKEMRVEGELDKQEYYERIEPVKETLDRLGKMIDDRAQIFDLDLDITLERISRIDRLSEFLTGNPDQSRLAIDSLVAKVLVFNDIILSIEPVQWAATLVVQ